MKKRGLWRVLAPLTKTQNYFPQKIVKLQRKITYVKAENRHFLRFRELFYIEIMCRFPHYMREFVSI